MTEQTVSEYANSLFPVEDHLLRQFKDEAAAQGLPEIQVPEEAARFLQLMIVLSGAKRVLEIGTLFGYSTIIMARALSNEGRVITLESETKHAEVAQRNLERAGLTGTVEVRLGPALETLTSLAGEKFDVVFIDADKRTYPRYLEWALKLSHPGSLILADNVWREGAVVQPEEDNADTKGLVAFNQAIAHNQQLFSTFVPTREAGDALSVSVVR